MKALVIMPTYGRIPFLNRALASFLSQDYDNKEMVIINDDKHIELRCDYPNVVCINLNKRILVGQKKNLGTNIGYHDLYIPFDDDDIMLPNRLSNCVNIHKNHPDIFLYAHKYSYTIYGQNFKITKSGSNTISYTREAWFDAGGYNHKTSCGEDQEFRNKVKNRLILDDKDLIDYVYNWGGINYHLTYSKTDDIEKIAYRQLQQMNLLNQKYYIEPDYEEYNKFIILQKRFNHNQKTIKIKHCGLGRISIE